MMPKFSVDIAATSANLGPGFDCMGLAINRYNRFTITPDEMFSINAKGPAAPAIPRTKDNLVVQGLELLLHHVGAVQTPRRWRIDIQADIPAGSGLGSSASAIAGGMLLGNEMVGYYEPRRQMSRWEVVQLATAMEGHPDNVTPALLGGAWLSVYEEHKLQSFALSLPENLVFAVGTPQIHVSTDESRKALSALVPRHDAIYNTAQAARLVLALERRDLSLLRDAFGDKIHEPYRTPSLPYYKEVVAAVLDAGAITVTLSGSGPTLLVWCDSSESAECAAEAMQQVWSEHSVAAVCNTALPDRTEPAVYRLDDSREADA
ncbi:homoserine kinase [Alicyclobacillus sp. SO9]|uniref:homoserine kinase n=1 Tax=Alicyclobacillus sp. SO9 TaxID=2665646 RepID=UPI0018E78247|nr:homoserine kinase [Alicyclobacillus sp. SO9]QQE77668.1 homoserine kinase [Alicyclobacillus sp. SO9]